jgi:DNA mismatch repair protein MutL
MKVQRLSEDLVKRIAAGEVIERPASVVKELIENSLDAGARKISVLIKGAGRLLIRISDDGFGMSKEDLLLSVERHTTSKIKTVEDIDQISSLGFRGEALYTIAAVSKLEITTCERDSEHGYGLRATAGTIQDISETGSPSGTTIEVKDLFWNTPARLKFLKSPNTEMKNIFETVAMHCLARPDVGFRLADGEKILIDTSPGQDLVTRIRSLYEGLGDDWVKLDYQSPQLEVTGFVGHPAMSRGDRSFQHFFVNQRPVKSPALGFSVESAFHSLVPEAKHPIFFIFITVNPQTIDVNVHPSKREIRFHKTQEVQDQLREAVRSALSRHFTSPYQPAESGKEVYLDRVKDSITAYFGKAESSHSGQERKYPPIPVNPVKERYSDAVSLTAMMPRDEALYVKALGCFDNLYWAVLLEDGLALMDLHAAHERVLYEKFLTGWRQHRLAIQSLLIPATFELSKEDFSVFREHQKTLKDLGFGIEEFGDASVIISQVPQYCEIHSLKDLILNILDDLKTFQKTTLVGESQLEERIILRACKSAVKAHDPLSAAEIERLVRDLFSLELPYTCPHGRPTILKFTGTDLARMFKRQ